MKDDNLTEKIIGCAYKVHNALGPGFLEKVYENALRIEIQKLGPQGQTAGTDRGHLRWSKSRVTEGKHSSAVSAASDERENNQSGLLS